MQTHRFRNLALVFFGFLTATLANHQAVRADEAANAREKNRELASESEIMGEIRYQEFLDRLFTPRESLDRTCKYMSSISTPPPAMKVALTFDDGPDPFGNPIILDVLNKYDIPATFFLTGQHSAAYPALVEKTANSGHVIIGNHSWDHPNFWNISSGAQIEQVDRTDALLGNLQNPRLFRFPYGNSTCDSIDHVRAKGYKIAGWHIDSCDWAYNATGTISTKNALSCEVSARNRSNMVRHIVDSVKAHKGGIILMHEVQPNTIQKLETIVQQLIAAGFSFGTLADADFQPCLR